MNELYQVLDGLHLNVDFHNEKRLIDDGLLESLDIVMLVDELMCHYDIEILSLIHISEPTRRS